MTVRVRAHSRLHFGLLPDGNESGRRFGGAGLMVRDPGIEVSARHSLLSRVKGNADQNLLYRAETILRKTLRAFQLRDLIDTSFRIEVNIAHCAPEHRGLGTGTQLSLAIAKCISILAGLEQDGKELAQLTTRGVRSAIGLHGFDQGGFLVDGGISALGQIAPLVSRVAFPEQWPILLIDPGGAPGIHGDIERRWFASERIQSPMRGRIEALLWNEILPAVAERDYARFGAALFEFNQHIGECFATAQGGAYASPRAERLVQIAHEIGVQAVGQSSWGPILFGICESMEQAHLLSNKLFEVCGDALRVTKTAAANTGAVVEYLNDAAERPLLLVSVRTVEEAEEAIAGGADIIDIKDPTQGSLGMASLDMIRQITRFVAGRLPVTAALGDLSDSTREIANALAVPEVPLAFIKVGFAGWCGDRTWMERFEALDRDRMGPSIPVAYADAERAKAPAVTHVAELAIRRKSPCLLIDTFEKGSGTLLEWIDVEELRGIVRRCTQANVPVALAGSLRCDDIPMLLPLQPAVLAFRAAACDNGERMNAVHRARVAELAKRINEGFLAASSRDGSTTSWNSNHGTIDSGASPSNASRRR